MNPIKAIASWIKGRPQPPEDSLTLRGLSFLATSISLVAMAWISGEPGRPALLLALTVAGHVFSWHRRANSPRAVQLSIMLGIVLIYLWDSDGLLALFSGGLLLPLARFLATAQAIGSFGLRTRKSLYDALAMSLAILLMLGEQAHSLGFLGFLVAFAIVALAFLGASHIASSGQHAERVAFPKIGWTVGMGALATAGTLGTAVLLFLVLPQNHAVGSAGPLPSRLDLTSGWPPPPSGTDDGRVPTTATGHPGRSSSPRRTLS